MAEAPTREQATLRTEYDDLARRLEIRPSVDVARAGFVRLFVGLMSLGLGWALLWDRYDKLDPSDLGLRYPVPFMAGCVLAGLVGGILIVLATLALVRSRRMARDEAALFARLLELRRLLELDA